MQSGRKRGNIESSFILSTSLGPNPEDKANWTRLFVFHPLMIPGYSKKKKTV